MSAFQKQVALNNFQQELVAIAVLTAAFLLVLIGSVIAYVLTGDHLPQFLIMAAVGAVGLIYGVLKYYRRKRRGAS